MKKKIMAMLFATLLCGSLVLSGCGSTSDDTDDTETEAAEDTADDTAEDAEVTYDELTLTFTTTYSEADTAGELLNYFVSYIEDASNGSITFEIYWGGTYAADGEELSFVGSGAVDMTMIGQSSYTDVLSLLNFPSQAGSYEEAIELMDYITFEDETTSPLILAQIEAQNVKMLGSTVSGSNGFCFSSEYDSLAEMAQNVLGVGMNIAAFEACGFSVTSTMPWDYYDSLSRGVVDCGYLTISSLLSMSIEEVCPYFYLDGTYTAGNFFTINLDVWNAMSEDTQALFEEATDATQEFSIELCYSDDEESAETIEAAGGSLNELSDEDKETIRTAFFQTGVEDARSYASDAGCTDEMETVLSVVSEQVGIDLE